MSTKHTRHIRSANVARTMITNISNTLQVDGQPVMEPVRLHHGAKIRIGGIALGEMVLLDYLLPDAEQDHASQQTINS